MAIYRGRKTDICRKVGFNIWGKAKCPSQKRAYPVGQHGPNKRDRRGSEYGEQLLAKQVIRRYFHLMEKQFFRTFEKARKAPGNTSINFLRFLELRLQTAVWRLGYAKSIFQARQMVSHCHIQVNGKPVNIPSYNLKVGDVVSVCDKSVSREMAKRNHYEAAPVPAYMDPDIQGFSGKIIALPEREDFPKFFEEQQVVEFYSK